MPIFLLISGEQRLSAKCSTVCQETLWTRLRRRVDADEKKLSIVKNKILHELTQIDETTGDTLCRRRMYPAGEQIGSVILWTMAW